MALFKTAADYTLEKYAGQRSLPDLLMKLLPKIMPNTGTIVPTLAGAGLKAAGVAGFAALPGQALFNWGLGQQNTAMQQEADAGAASDVARRNLYDMQRRIQAGQPPVNNLGRAGGLAGPTVLTSNPTQQASLAGAGQSWDQPQAKPTGEQMMAHLDAQIAAKGLSPFKQKVLRAKVASRLINQVGADPLAVGMWVQGGSTAFEELAKLRSQENVAGTRAGSGMSDTEKTVKSFILKAKTDRMSENRQFDAFLTNLQKDPKKAAQMLGTAGRMPWNKSASQADMVKGAQARYPTAHTPINPADIKEFMSLMRQVSGGGAATPAPPVQAGGGRMMTFPDGSSALIPQERVAEAIASGAK